MAPEHSPRREKYVHEPDPGFESAAESVAGSGANPATESVVDSITDSATGSGAGNEVLDLDHLARYTMGNRDLERELLHLFRAQIQTQAAGVAQARDAEDWRFATHTLKGVARSIGARAIAETAEKLEQLGHGGNRTDYGRLLVALAAQIAACEREIARIVGR